ncbi:FAD:protein FMN transferase [Pseudoduganella lutea]|uniref:FAD:protein FMN transferase n=1 Tax=Pseudoduganella lutea TaxID=321985 RepID=A0A4V0Z4B9_9BURK|nr:FAD:protein FMN transferase [Pseudoduganella lutea]QBE66403.1 FAD:protein FMN transferase [Pseudoduganella lutea]
MFHQTFASMNTRFSMVLPAIDEHHGMQLAREAQVLLQEQEVLMSRFDAHGALAALNRIAAHGPAPVPAALWEVLDACRRHHHLTGGAFDIAQGGPQGSRGMQLLDVDAAARTVRFDAAGMQLDLGGIGKGIALDAVRQRLLARGVDQALLSFGESSLVVIGKHPAADSWPVGVEDLFHPGRSLHRFDLRDTAMSTSGNRVGQAHIFDPSDGQPISGCRTVSVSCAGAADAEALSTALFVLAPARRVEVLRHYPCAQAVEFIYLEKNGHWTVEKRWQHD